MKKVFAIFDDAVKAYLTPFHCLSVGEAIRTWTQAVNDPQTIMAMSPADYTLFEIGSYDEKSGMFKSLDAFVNLGNAVQYLRKTDCGRLGVTEEMINGKQHSTSKLSVQSGPDREHSTQ